MKARQNIQTQKKKSCTERKLPLIASREREKEIKTILSFYLYKQRIFSN